MEVDASFGLLPGQSLQGLGGLHSSHLWCLWLCAVAVDSSRNVYVMFVIVM